MIRYKRNTDIVERKIHGAYYLIDITDNYMDEHCRLFEINEMGDYIWNKLTQCDESNNLIDYLVEEIKEMIIDDISSEVIRNDVELFVKTIENEGFLEVTENGRT